MTCSTLSRGRCHRRFAGLTIVKALATCCVVLAALHSGAAEPAVDGAAGEAVGQEKTAERQAKLEADFARLLRGATLEGNYTRTGPDGNRSKLSQEKYTLGEVKKLGGHRWLIQARIQYGEHDVTLPIAVLVRWAGDTPVIIIDELGLPEFGTVSARVMFFGGHYAGYWKHGNRGGHLFGVVKPRQNKEQPTSQ